MGNKNATANKTNHDFIINFNRNHSVHHPSDAICNKRVIFISLIGLYQTYINCPPHILYNALFILPLKKQWIYSPIKYIAELQAVSSGLIHNGLDFDSDNFHQLKEFLELIKWKDSQGFVFWAKDKYTASYAHNHVHPFWRFVSNKLVTLYDPITSGNYDPLALDIVYGDISMDVFRELHFMTLKYETMKSVLHASNPESFRVITAYKEDHPQFIKYQQLDDDDSDAQSDDEWWVSSEY